MSSTALLPARRWTCDRCFVTKDEVGQYRPADWIGAAVCRYGGKHTEGDYCASCAAVLEKAFKPLATPAQGHGATFTDDYPGATETTMGAR